jgi:hypothetical protein
MQRRMLEDVIRNKFSSAKILMSTYAILNSYLAFEKNYEKETVTFFDFLIYLNMNGFTIKPDLDILHKKDEEIFLEFIKGIDREFRIRTRHVKFLSEHYHGRLKPDFEIFGHCISPLHFAVSCNDYKFAEKLIDHHADVNLNAIFGSILQTAVKYADEDLVALLLENGADVKNKYFNPLREATDKNKHSPSKKTQNILNLLNNADACSLKPLKPFITKQIDNATKAHLPEQIVSLIASYDTRSYEKKYFKTGTTNNTPAIVNEERMKFCL